MRNSYFLEVEGPDAKALAKAIAWARSLNSNDPAKADVVVGVPILSNFESDVIQTALGPQVAMTLRKSKAVQLGELKIVPATERDVPQSAHVVIAIYPTPKLLDRLDGIRGVSDFLAVPWSRHEVEEWIGTWRALDLDGGSSSGVGLRLSKTVENALTDLNKMINVSTGVSHPSDRASAIELFERLHDASVGFDPAEVRAWLVTKGCWESRHADAVREIAEKVQSGKRPRRNAKVGLRWNDDIVQRWQGKL